MKSLLKTYALAGLCFVLLGTPIMSIYLAIQSSLVEDHWRAVVVPLWMTIVFSILATLTHGIFMVPRFGVPMGVAALVFVACMRVRPSTTRGIGAGAITGAVAG